MFEQLFCSFFVQTVFEQNLCSFDLYNICGQKILVFQDLINDNHQALPSSFKGYNREIKDFLQVLDKKIRVTSKFLEYLNSQSDFHSFQNPRKNILKRKIIDVGILFIYILIFLKILM